MARDTEKFEQLLQQVAGNVPSLTTLTLDCADLDQKDLTRLSQALVGNTHIATLNLNGNNITDEGVKILMAALAQNRTITTLGLGNNNIGPEGASALAQNRTITTLGLHSNNIGPEGASALAQNRTITTLNLYNNNIGPTGARALAQNRTITTLDLNYNNIGNEGASALAQNRTITTLILYYNNIGNEGASALAQNRAITALDLGANNIGPLGASALAQNNTITTLDLNYNNIGPEGARAYLEALKKNTTFFRFEWSDRNSRISNDIRAAIQEELNINQACRQVIKEHIQTLMNIRTLEPTNPLAVMPIELMFLFFKELMPGFNPDTFAQTNIPPADAATLAKARDKLAAIAAQQGLSIRLEPSPPSTSSAVPTCPPIRVETPAASGSNTKKSNQLTTVCQALRPLPLPTHFYAVTEQTLLVPEDKTEFSQEEQHQLLQPTNRCFLYSTAEQAQTHLRNMTKTRGFFRTMTPLLFRVTTNASLADFTEGMPVECRQLNTIMSYRQGAALEQAELLQAQQVPPGFNQEISQPPAPISRQSGMG